jgi:hypothetical protein
VLAARLPGRQPLITFVTIGELTQWTRLRHWRPGSRAAVDSRLPDKPVISGARSIAVIWGDLSAAATGRGRPPGQRHMGRRLLHSYGIPLATLNIKDFADFAEHDGLALITR